MQRIRFRRPRPPPRPRIRLCLSEAGCRGGAPACCKRGVRVEDDGNVTFSSPGKCIRLTTVQDPSKFALSRVVLDPQNDPAGALESAAAGVPPDGADALFICPPNSLSDTRRRRRQIFAAVEPEEILVHVLAPDLAFGEVEPPTTAPTEPEPTTPPEVLE